MSFDLGNWMRAVWLSLIEPAETARKVIAMRLEPAPMWMAMVLIAVLNVLFVAVIQFVSPVPIAMPDDAISLSPFAFTAVIGLSLVVMVLMIFYIGRLLGGEGDLQATLALMVWFNSVNLTLTVGQILLILINPFVSAMYNLVSLGALIWCIVNFVNVLHGFQSLLKSSFVLALSLIATGVPAGVALVLLGVTPGGPA